MTTQSDIEQAFYRPDDAAKFLGVGRTKLHYIAENDADFPQKIRITPRYVGWRKIDLIAWLDRKAAIARGELA